MQPGRRTAGIAIVTGASGGIGSAAARRLADEGRSLLLCGRDADRLDAVAGPLRAAGGEITTLTGDVADPRFAERLLEATAERPVEALVHSAGLPPHVASAERLLEVNLGATARLTAALRPCMAQGAAAVLVASLAGYMPMAPEAEAAVAQPLSPEAVAALAAHAPTPGHAYALAKRGVLRLVEREAPAFAERGARIVSVSPGMIDTDMTRDGLQASDFSLRAVQRLPLRRFGAADEVAAVIGFLCSPAASYVTGCDLRVDGGAIAAVGY